MATSKAYGNTNYVCMYVFMYVYMYVYACDVYNATSEECLEFKCMYICMYADRMCNATSEACFSCSWKTMPLKLRAFKLGRRQKLESQLANSNGNLASYDVFVLPAYLKKHQRFSG